MRAAARDLDETIKRGKALVGNANILVRAVLGRS
jgi:hypothetical protein